jgi:hypothetical protein
MAEDIQIQLLDIYQPISDEDVQAGKRFVLRRESAANGLASLVDALLSDAAEEMAQTAYKYGIDPKEFMLSPQYNEQMFRQMSRILDELDDEIFDLIESYSTRCTKDEDKKKWLLPWILALGRNGKGLRRSLEDRLWMFSRDIEAMIVAARTANMDVTRAVSVIRSNLHTSYLMPGMQEAFANSSLYKAQYIRTHGVKKGNRGSSSSEANNIIRFAKTTVQMAWMRYHHRLYEEQGAAGYYVLRGSTFPCDLCDSMTGFHPIEDTDGYPMYHAHCQCFTVPVFSIKD